MALQRVRRRRRASITSLIDVIFLLLLFFMLSSTFSRFSELSVSGVSQISERSGGAADTTILSIEIRAEGVLLDGDLADDAALRTALQRQAAELSGVNVRVDALVKTQRLIDVLLLLNGFEGLKINLVDAL
ncbi:MAG: biopolymer transporter ExbD [Pseudomonadota bacterium]